MSTSSQRPSECILNDEKVQIDLLKTKKAQLIQEKQKLNDQIRSIDDEIGQVEPNALKSLKIRTVEDLARADVKTLKTELNLDRPAEILHRVLTHEQKERVLRIADAIGPTEAEKETGVHEQNIYRWRREGCTRKKGSGRPVSYPDFDKELLDYLIEQRRKGIGISSRRFIIYARGLAKQKKLDKVRFSRGWFQKFKKRNNISIRKKTTSHYKNLDEIKQSVEKFRREIHEALFKENSIYDHNHVVNVDETGVPRDAPPKTTLDVKGAKHVPVLGGNKEKENTTIVPAISLTGKRLNTLIIVKGKGVKKVKCALPHDFYINYNEDSSWINTTIMVRWVDWVLEPHAKKLPPEKRGLLLMDNHKCHIDEKVLSKIKALRYDVKLLPPNTTGLLQPLDVGFNRLFKDKYSLRWENWAEEIVTDTKGTNIPSPSKELSLTWIHRSIKEVQTEHLINCWNSFRQRLYDSDAVLADNLEQQLVEDVEQQLPCKEDDEEGVDTEEDLDDDELPDDDELMAEFEEEWRNASFY